MKPDITVIKVDINKLMDEKVKEIQNVRELYPHETIIPPDVIPEGFCQCCGFKLGEDDLGFCGKCETEIYGN
jgi:hypothetical protein